ncbi:glycosyltransferase family 2 protein [Roseobacter sp. YSTF-M11]|uniref:Glycosyltransferase family 2 protein n=1 Tax=Roseobacter insulae TaxID=2859783 RepID=A0A9X1FSG9_9RHOB|nr:glycosyltransferase family 2 protein [Roseobacter insulae]MBW4706833.1 glycosyltransferase family 2 protein [Roseobacter insulae]
MMARLGLWTRYKLRLRRRRLLWRGFRSRHQLNRIKDLTAEIAPGDILLFATVRNEAIRLPYFLEHYRRLGVSHFLIVDNDSTDDTAAVLTAAPDVSFWHTTAGYKDARFGMDWLMWLLIRHGHGHWTITVDADELLVYPDHDSRPLPHLTAWLEQQGQEMMGATMLDLYPKGSPDAQRYTPGQNPCDVLNWFDGYGYWAQRQPKMDNLWLQGGARARCFFADEPRRAPTLNKIPLVKWNRRYVFVNSTHNALPRRLNRIYDAPGREKVSGVLLHTKFLPGVSDRAREEQSRQQHFSNSEQYDTYYHALAENPDLWDEQSIAYRGWQQLVDLRLMSRGSW